MTEPDIPNPNAVPTPRTDWKIQVVTDSAAPPIDRKRVRRILAGLIARSLIKDMKNDSLGDLRVAKEPPSTHD